MLLVPMPTLDLRRKPQRKVRSMLKYSAQQERELVHTDIRNAHLLLGSGLHSRDLYGILLL